ncbi:TPA: SMEK domain-containing protein, partial [Vibrio parahaemolyticus]
AHPLAGRYVQCGLLRILKGQNMITRGYIIGEIIDGLTSISQQVETRCKLGLTDLNRYLEDFFKDYLNEVMDWSLTNLNDERSNEPGVDLGDRNNSVAIQVTSSRTSEKVNSTLGKVLKREDEFNSIIVLVIGKKQKTYSLNADYCKKTNFSEDNIWDVNDLCMKTISLPLDHLHRIHDLIKRNLAKVTVELEIPDEDGNFSTSIDSYVEKLPKPQLSDFKTLHDFITSRVSDYEFSSEDLRSDYELLSRQLTKLPRITREFYAFLVERRDAEDDNPPNHSCSTECFFFNYNRLERICQIPDLKGELTLLMNYDFIDIDEPMELGQSPFVKIFAPKVKIDGFLYELADYVEAKEFGYRKSLVMLDFSDF